MIKSYHNTTKETGPELAQSISKAMNQEDVIMSLFETYRNIYGKLNVMSPSYIQGIWINGVDRKAYPPITSIRRAMTTLTRKGMLIKTDKCHVVVMTSKGMIQIYVHPVLTIVGWKKNLVNVRRKNENSNNRHRT